MTEYIDIALSDLVLFSVILTEYVRMDPGCMSVCLCVCVFVKAPQPKWLGRF